MSASGVVMLSQAPQSGPCTLCERCDALHVPDEPAGLDHDGVVCAAHSLRDLRTRHVHRLLHALPIMRAKLWGLHNA